ncbi:hypothetical protein OnM2_c1596o23 [Erysiphe neolycopersici]|uniref:Uncharacterized protein n=1 Tax=Erysiphe neolycopersici TaxID=212602 RepID=A0A420I3R2_9PEZI|nr:hypothetical protein OnM2_c1596o23 [Erysiphe neolycopersici]
MGSLILSTLILLRKMGVDLGTTIGGGVKNNGFGFLKILSIGYLSGNCHGEDYSAALTHFRIWLS